MNRNLQATSLAAEVLVAGGGISGVACALSAARNGAQVILCQDRPVLGGNASSEVRMHIVGANSGRPCCDLKLEPRESGIVEEIRLENSMRNAQRSPSMFDFILYDKCCAEKNITLMLNTAVVGVEKEGNKITRVEALRLSTEDRFQITAKIFVDCTGDSTMATAAGAVCFEGREDKKKFGESLALDEADQKSLGSTLLFMGRKHDKPMPFTPPSWARKFSEDDFKLRPHATGDVDFGLEYGFWWIEWGGQFDTIRQNEMIRHELLAIVMGIWDHIKNDGDHGAENWALDWFGAVPGKRESRRLIGRHVLNEGDVLQSRAHADTIAYGGWPIDLHPPEGVDRPDEPPCTQNPVPWIYDIPLGCCIARDLDNLMFAGRNLSATHVAFASTRVMATCGVVGEGVGVTAAKAALDGMTPNEIREDSQAMADIQQQLLRQDVFLIGKRLMDQDDLALRARVAASSETEVGPASNVISGMNRAIHEDRGVPADRVVTGTHRWISEPMGDSDEWIELRWAEPVQFTRVELVFDSALHRYLTLTQSDAYAAKMVWGEGQPEMVKHYEVEMEVQGKWIAVVKQDRQWQRRASHVFEGSKVCSALRVRVVETWGSPSARIIRLGVYP